MTRFRDLPAPTHRLFVLALAIAIPLELAMVARPLVAIAVVGVLVLALTTAVAWSASTPPRDFRVSRRHEPRLYLGADNAVTLVVESFGRRPVQVRLRDTPPSAFRSSSIFFGGTVGAVSSIEFSYDTRPANRGEFHFGDVTLRWLTPLGLLWRQRTCPLAETVAVYPNLLDVHTYDVLARRGMLVEFGSRHARAYGRGTEFESLREYQPDDDYRRINWKATARRHVPISTLYETERSQRIIIMLDLGRMMQTKVGELSRLDLAVNASLLLAYVALVRGDRVGLLAFSDTIRVYLPARRGRGHFYSIVEKLYAVRAETIESDYAAAFNRLRNDLHGRALVALFTDLTDRETARTLARQLVPLARHHLPLCVTLRDPMLDTRAHQLPDDGRQVYEKVVATLLVDERLTVLDELRRAGVETVDAPADRLTPATISRYLQIKERGRL